MLDQHQPAGRDYFIAEGDARQEAGWLTAPGMFILLRIIMTFRCLTTLLVWAIVGGTATVAEEPARRFSEGLYECTNWRIDEGLPNNSVLSLLVSARGTLLMGSYEGIVEFDGETFQITPPPPETLLADKTITLREALDGTLWYFGPKGGVGTVHDGKMRTLLPPHSVEAGTFADSNGGWLVVKGERVVSLTSTGLTEMPMPPGVKATSTFSVAGEVWFRSTGGVLFRRAGASWQECPLPQDVPCVVAAPIGGSLWAAAKDQLFAWEGNRFVEVLADGASIRDVSRWMPAPAGGAWVRAENHWRPWDLGHWISPVAQSADAPLTSVDLNGALWIVSGPRVVVQPQNGDAQELDLGRHGISSRVTALAHDAEGNAWISTLGTGLLRLRERVFDLFIPKDGVAALPHAAIVTDASGAVWAGALDHIAVSRWKDGAFTVFRGGNPPGPRVSGLLTEPDGGLTVAASWGGMWHLSPEGNWTRILPEIPWSEARATCRDTAGRLWVGGTFGVVRSDPEGPRFFKLEDGLLHLDVCTMAASPDGSVWIGTAAGVCRWKDGQWFTIPAAGPAPGEQAHALHLDATGALWIGTRGGGVRRYADGKLSVFTTSDGLVSDQICGIAEDQGGYLWFTTYRGLMRIKRTELEARARGEDQPLSVLRFGRSDGLPSSQFSDFSVPGLSFGPNGDVWAPTGGGLVRLDQSRLRVRPRPVPVEIRSVRVDGVPRDLKKPIVLEPGENRITISYGAISLGAPEKISYRYRLEGGDRKWVLAGAQREISYAGLPPGNYSFRVMAANEFGLWNDTEARIGLLLRPHLWQTWWFWTGMGLLAAALLAGFRHFELRRARATEEMRSRIARDLHDEVGSSVGTIAMYARQLDENSSAGHGRMILEIALETVETLKEIVWLTHPTSDRLDDGILRMRTIVEQMLGDLPHTFTARIDPPSATLPLIWKRNLLPLFREAIHNAAKHSGASRMEIEIRLVRRTFTLVIADDGCGFDPEQATPGSGLLNFQRRAREMGADLEIKSGGGAGTTIRLQGRI